MTNATLGRRRAPRGRVALGLALAGLAACGGDAPEDGGGGATGASPDSATRADSAAGPATAASGVRLLARREVEVGGRPIGLVARRMNADETMDVVLVTRAPGLVQPLLGGRDGLVPTGAGEPLGGDYPLAPVDVAGLGFAVALQDTHELLWFGDSNPLGAPVRVELSSAPRAIGVGESPSADAGAVLVVGSDGALTRVAVTQDNAERLGVTPLPIPGLKGRPTLVSEIAGHLVVGAQLSESLHVLRVSEGAATHLREIALGGIPRAAAASDLDGDGDPEWVVVGGDRSCWAFGLGAAGGHATWLAGEAPPIDLGAPGAVPVDVEPVDLNGDGREELVLIDFYDSGYGVLGGVARAEGTFAPALIQKEYAGQDPVDGAVGDFDGDGHADLAVANRNARRVSLILGSGFASPERVSFYQSRRVPTAANPARVTSANVDDDPLPEAIVICAGDRVVMARRNRFGLLEATGETLAGGSAARALVAGPRQPGGPTRVALYEAGADGARLIDLARDATGAWARTAQHALGVDAGDLVGVRDGTGVTLAAVDPRGGTVHVIPPGAETAHALKPLTGTPRAACAMSLDGDDDDELVVATADTLYVAEARERTLTEVARIGIPGHTPKRMCVADVDGDGNQDLVILYGGERDTSPGRIAVLTQTTRGTLTRAALVETGLAPAAVAAGDVDGDGRAEIFCAAQNSHNVNVWTPNADGGSVLRRLPDIGAGLGPLDVHLVDLDGDGRLDLVTANNFSHDLSVAYNLTRE